MWGALSQNDSEVVSRVKRGIESLSDGYRTILSLLLFEGYDYQEVAEILDVKEATVRSQYMRGRKRLLEILKEMPGQTQV